MSFAEKEILDGLNTGGFEGIQTVRMAQKWIATEGMESVSRGKSDGGEHNLNRTPKPAALRKRRGEGREIYLKSSDQRLRPLGVSAISWCSQCW